MESGDLKSYTIFILLICIVAQASSLVFIASLEGWATTNAQESYQNSINTHFLYEGCPIFYLMLILILPASINSRIAIRNVQQTPTVTAWL